MIEAGEYELGPDNADLLLHTYTAGAAAAMGHNLTLRVDDWSAQLSVGSEPAACALSVRADLRTLVVVEGHGGATPLTDGNRRDILANAAKSLDTATHPTLTFESSAVSGSWERATVTGTLSLHGRAATQTLTVAHADGYRLTGTVTQSAFGIKAFTTMLGALKVRDDVDVEVTVAF